MVIDDVSDKSLNAGLYLLKVTLDDGKDKVTFNLGLIILNVSNEPIAIDLPVN